MVTKVKTHLAKKAKNKSENSPQESHEIEESSGHICANIKVYQVKFNQTMITRNSKSKTKIKK